MIYLILNIDIADQYLFLDIDIAKPNLILNIDIGQQYLFPNIDIAQPLSVSKYRYWQVNIWLTTSALMQLHTHNASKWTHKKKQDANDAVK